MSGKEPLKILGIAGSPRQASYNRRLLALAAKMLVEKGVESEVFDVREKRVPMFDPEVESEFGFPPLVKELRAKIEASDAVLLASPEYNAGCTPLMKSIVDWGSRTDPETGTKNVWRHKVVGLVSASPGAFGGVRGTIVLRQSFVHVEALVIPEFTSVSFAHKAFNDDGTLVNDYSVNDLNKTLDNLIEFAGKMR
jgi:NAD(P)H-dependent FMN reductase